MDKDAPLTNLDYLSVPYADSILAGCELVEQGCRCTVAILLNLF